MSSLDYENDDFEDDDDGEYEDYEDPEEKERQNDMFFYNEMASREITNELALLDNRDLLDFMVWELERVKFEQYSQTVLMGFEFTNQYVIQLYNIRENKTTKMNTGAGNIYSFIDAWFKKTVFDLMIEIMFGGLKTVTEEDMIDVNTNLLLDMVEWKSLRGIPLMEARGLAHEDPEDSAGPVDDEPPEDM